MRQTNCCPTLVYRSALCAFSLLACLPIPAQTPTALPSIKSSCQFAACGIACDTWQRKLAPVKIGLTRAEAEKVLALAHARLLFSDQWGSSQSDTYWLDKAWRVTVSYDYRGAKRDKNGAASKFRNSQNKVVALPAFVQEEKTR